MYVAIKLQHMRVCLVPFCWSVVLKPVSALLVQLWIYARSIMGPSLTGTRQRWLLTVSLAPALLVSAC